ncbi:MAG: efflux RND transporter permease subunit [Acidobacteriota bacterium]|nr:efflux RND transporter permease subunit [Acidobacteriota bacterium]
MLEKTSKFVIKRRYAVVAVIFLLTLFFAYQMKNLHFDNRVIQWIPKDDPVLKLLLHTGKQFGPNDLVLVMLKPFKGEVFSPEILNKVKALTEELKENEEIFSVTSISNIPHITQIEGGIEVRDFLEDIPESSKELQKLKDYALSKEGFVNNVISADGKWLAVSIYIDPKEDIIKSFRETVKPAVEKHLKDCAEIYYSGSPSDAYFADEFVSSDIKKLVPIIVILIMMILYFSFRHLNGVVFPLAVVGIATIWMFGLMGLFNISMNIITPALPVLLIALGSAYGIHVVNSIYNEGHKNVLVLSDIQEATKTISMPVILAAATTVAGFISFLTAKLKLIEEFGIFSAFGIAFAAVISLTLIPAGSAIFISKRKSASKSRITIFSFILNVSSGLVRKHRKLALILSLVVFFAFGPGLFRIKRQVNFTEYYPEASQPRVALKIVQDHFAGFAPVTLYFKGENVKSAGFLRLIRRAENYLYSLEGINNPFSISDFIQELNFELNNRYHLPDNDRGVGNLWFFLEGRDELKQFVTDDLKESLIFSRISNSEMEFMKYIHRKLYELLDKEFSKGFTLYELNKFSSEESLRLRKEEARYILDEIGWLVRFYGDNHFDTQEAMERLIPLIDDFPSPEDKDVKDILANEFRDYIFSEYFDFEISTNVKEKLYEKLMDAVSSGAVSEEDFEMVLKKVIPHDYFDEEISSDVASTLALRVKEAKDFVFSERSCRELEEIIPEKAMENEAFSKKLFGLLYEIADDLVVLSCGVVDFPSGTVLKFDQVEQSGYPAFLTRLDHFLLVSQIQSFALALGITFILMIFMGGSLIWGFISIIPIIFTLGIIYGFCGLFGIPLDYGTVMVAGVSIGVGIDYVIHFTHGIREEMREGLSLEEAVHRVYLDKGKAILSNSLAVMGGFVVLLFSTMSPLRHFGGVMSGSMFLAALSCLVILPALILIVKPKIGGKL